MEQTLSSISPAELYGRLGTAGAPTVVDVRRPADFATAGELLVSAYHRDPDKVEQWRRNLPNGRPVGVHCAHRHEVSPSVATARRAAGPGSSYFPDRPARRAATGRSAAPNT